MKPITGKEFYSIIGKMPRLKHSQEGESGEDGFDLEKSQVIAWLKDNLPPLDVLGQIFWKLKLAGAIIWDPSDRTWRGRNPEDYEKARAAKAEVREAKKEAKAVARASTKAKTAKKRGRKKQTEDEVLSWMISEFVITHHRFPTVAELRDTTANDELMKMTIDGGKALSQATFYLRLRWAKAQTDSNRIELRPDAAGRTVCWMEGKKVAAGQMPEPAIQPEAAK